MPFRRGVDRRGHDRSRAIVERATAQDPWDGRTSKEAVFTRKVKAIATRSEVVDLDPILDRLRLVKSPAEIAVIREATRLASLGILEGMQGRPSPGCTNTRSRRSPTTSSSGTTRMGIGYFALVATGTNAAWPHYHAAQSTARRRRSGALRLRAGLQVLHLRRHADVSRPTASSAPRQREMYGIYVKLYQALMSSIGPGPAADRRRSRTRR